MAEERLSTIHYTYRRLAAQLNGHSNRLIISLRDSCGLKSSMSIRLLTHEQSIVGSLGISPSLTSLKPIGEREIN